MISVPPIKEKNIFTGAFAHLTVNVERDAFRIAIRVRFNADQLRIHVVRSGFRHLRERIRSRTIPGADADVHTCVQRFFSQILCPFPARDIDLNRAAHRIHAGRAVAAHHHRSDVACTHLIGANERRDLPGRVPRL